MWGACRSAEARRRPGSLAHRLALTGLLLGALLGLPGRAAAQGLPAAYGALVVQPTGLPQRHEFDLNPALERARQAGKQRLYIFLGAHDCRYCRQYEAFLEKHAAELVPRFKPYFVVDLRSALMVTAPKLFLKIGERSLPYSEFQRSIGDERARLLVYPNVWLLDTRGQPLMQMPAGTGTFETVPEQIEILELVN